MKNSIKMRLGKLVNYATCVALLPFVIMIYQYQRNIQHLSLWQVLVFCCIVAIGFLVLYFIAKSIIKSELGAFLFATTLFFSFFRFHALDFTGIVVPRASRITQVLLFFGIALLLAVFIAFLCLKHREKLKSKTVTIVVFVMLCAILFQNVALILLYNYQQDTNDSFYKEDFNITQTLEGQPNIYWIHCDGMLGFDSMSRFFGDNQEEFTQELENRGFWINREATLVVNHSTSWAVPALMNPFYYDRVLSWKFDPEYAKSYPQNEDLLNNPSLRLEANDASNTIARQKNETVMGFGLAGYNTSTIYYISKFFYPTVNQFYTNKYRLKTTQDVSNTMQLPNSEDIENFGNLLTLLASMTAISESLTHDFETKVILERLLPSIYTISDIVYRVDLFYGWEDADSRRANLKVYATQANSLYDTFEMPAPKFIIYGFNMAHNPFYFNEYGYYYAADANNPMRYPAHHTFCADTLLKYIDLILDHDPEAVIVLQADHGLHTISESKIMETFSCTAEEARGLWNQVMSAVRLPEEQMTPETEQILSDPRNISRYLINTYVGENYEYIPNQYRQSIISVYNNNVQAGN